MSATARMWQREERGGSADKTVLTGYDPAEVDRSVTGVHAKTEFWELIERAVEEIPATYLVIV